MRPIVRQAAAAAALAVFACTAATAGGAGSIQWQKDFKTAQAAAKKARKVLMVDFYADW